MSIKKYIINFTLIIALTFFGLWVALKDSFHEVSELLSKLSVLSVLAVVAYGIAYNLIIAWIYKVLGKRVRGSYRFKEAIEVSFVGFFFSGVTPSATGGQVGQAYILKNQGFKMSEALSILWVDFVIYQIVMVVYTTILIALQFAYYSQVNPSFFLLVIIGAIVNSAVILFLFTMVLFPKFYAWLSKRLLSLLAKLKFVKNPQLLIEKMNVQIESFHSELIKLKHMKKEIIKCVGINILRLTILYACPLFIAYQLQLDIHPGMLYNVITMTAFVYIANAFIPIPGASGSTEVAFITIFATLFPLAATNSMMILWRFSTYHVVVLIGGVMFLYLKSKYNRNKVRHIIQEDDYKEEESV